MTGLNFRHIPFCYGKFGSVIYQACAGWIRYPADAGHIENSIFHPVDPLGKISVYNPELII